MSGEPKRYRLAANIPGDLEAYAHEGDVVVFLVPVEGVDDPVYVRIPRELLVEVKPPRPAGDVLDAGRLLGLLDTRRTELGISWRDVCRQAGLKADSTITRLKQGHTPDVQNLARLLLWLGDTDLKSILREAPDAA